jgi:hypothetical protein
MTFLVLPAQLPPYKIGNPILLTPFVGQTAFVAVRAAMIVNISWRRKKNRRLRFSEKQRESSSLRHAARLYGILAQVAEDKAF